MEMEVAKLREADVRSWLRRGWGPDLNWVEAARGGTTGLPDVIFPIDPEMPVELKVGAYDGRGSLRFRVRPSQFRYHTLRAKAGKRSAFLVAVGSRSDFDVWAMPGSAWLKGSLEEGWRPYLRPCLFKQKAKPPEGFVRDALAYVLGGDDLWVKGRSLVR